MYRAFLGLGSNLGDRMQFLQRAVDAIAVLGCIGRASLIYETEPVGMMSTHPFYNMAVELQTELCPAELFKQLEKIERKLGRSAATHLKDREIDMDILLYEDYYFEDTSLEVPHPQLAERRFALMPLDEIAAEATHPVSGETVRQLLNQCPDASAVTKTKLKITLPT